MQLSYGRVLVSPRTAIHVVRIQGAELEEWELADLSDMMSERIMHRFGEQVPDIVLVRQDRMNRLRMSGSPPSMSRVREGWAGLQGRWERVVPE